MGFVDTFEHSLGKREIEIVYMKTDLCLAEWTLPTEDGRWLIDTGWPRAARLKWRRQIKGSLKISGEHLHLHRVAANGKTCKTAVLVLPRFGGYRSGLAHLTYTGALVKMKMSPADFSEPLICCLYFSSNFLLLLTVQWLFGLKKILFTIDAPPGIPRVSKNHIFFTNETVFLLR